MKKIVLVLLVFFTLQSFGQSKKYVDSLAKIAKSYKLSPLKIDEYMRVSRGYFSVDLETSKLYQDSILILSKKIHYNKGYAYYYEIKAYIQLVNGKNLEAIRYSNKAIELNKKYKDTLRCVASKWLLSECYASEGKKLEAIKILESALKEIENTNHRFFKTELEIYPSLALNYSTYNKYKAFFYLNKCIDLTNYVDKEKKVSKVAIRYILTNCYSSMAELYIDLEQYDKALYYFNLFEEKEFSSPEYIHTFYLYMLSKINWGLENYETALNLNKRALQSALKVKDKDYLIKCYNLFSKIYYGQRDFGKSIKYAEKAIYKQPDNKNRFEALQSLGKSYFAIGNFSKALNYQTKALNYFEDNFGYSIYQDISSSHFELKDFKKATDYYKIFSEGKTKQLIDDNNKNVAELQNKFELEERNSQIKKSALIRKQQSQKLKNNKALLKTITVSLVVTFLLLGLSFYLFKKYKKNNLLLSEKNNLIEINNKTLKDSEVSLSKALLQKEILLKEVHHRVKNNLQLVTSLLNLQSRKLNNKEVDTFVEKSRSRIDAISLVHQNLYLSDDFEKINFNSYLNQLIDNTKRSLSDEINTNISFKIDACEVAFNLDILIPLGLIINEIITNSIKYAFHQEQEGNICITLKKAVDQTKYELVVADDGIGILNLSENKSLGIRLINLLTEQINGKLETNFSNGVCYTITFKNN